jgi:DNA-binding transcriptional regulator YiaG
MLDIKMSYEEQLQQLSNKELSGEQIEQIREYTI